MAKANDAKPPLEAAAAALARRDYSAAELRTYLERHGAGGDEALRAVGRLQAAGYVDDARVALARACVLAERGYGDAFIRADLERRGLEPEHVELAVSNLEPERARATALMLRSGAAARVGRRLLAKGFDAQTVADAVAASATGRDTAA